MLIELIRAILSPLLRFSDKFVHRFSHVFYMLTCYLRVTASLLCNILYVFILESTVKVISEDRPINVVSQPGIEFLTLRFQDNHEIQNPTEEQHDNNRILAGTHGYRDEISIYLLSSFRTMGCWWPIDWGKLKSCFRWWGVRQWNVVWKWTL